jgi:Fe-S oxidoreductase
MGLERIDKSLRLCWLCGSCFGRGPTEPHNWKELNLDPTPNERCPSYEYFKFRTYTAMDRNSLATLVYREGYPITDDLKEVIYSCVTCGVCSEICGLMDPLDINLAVREEIVEKSSLLPSHEKLREIQDRSGNPYNEKEESRSEWAEGIKIKNLTKEKAENLFFVGCSGAFRPSSRKIAVATAQLLKKAGLDFGILGVEEKCCGYIPKMLGDLSLFKKNMTENIEALNSLKIQRLITFCPGCLFMFKSYPDKALNFEVIHSVQIIDQLIQAGKLKPRKISDMRITYHDPCDLGRKCRVFDSPRNVLKAVPGVQFVEMERHGRWAYCCGGGGGVEHILPDMVDFTSRSRMREAEIIGAKWLITACPQCRMTLLKASKGIGSKIKIEDISVFISQLVD